MIDLYEPACEGSGRILRLCVDGVGPFVVQGNKILIGQVLANTIENAMRHTDVGAQVTVELDRAAERIRLRVADDGPGVPESERAAVLRRFYRLERSRTSEGSGLGLSLVAAICDLHGATLVLEDNHPGLAIEVTFGAEVDRSALSSQRP